MKRSLLTAIIVCLILALTGCGSDHHDASPIFVTQIVSDPAFDGDIEQTAPDVFIVTQGMIPTVQSVFAGINPVTLTESRAFLDFHLGGAQGVPSDAIIESAFLDIFISSIQPLNGTIPIRIELVSFQPPNLIPTDFNRTDQPPLVFTTIEPPIFQGDVGRHISVDVTRLMEEVQALGLPDFQVRILADLVVAPPGLIEINDTTGVNRESLAPLLQVSYF